MLTDVLASLSNTTVLQGGPMLLVSASSHAWAWGLLRMRLHDAVQGRAAHQLALMSGMDVGVLTGGVLPAAAAHPTTPCVRTPLPAHGIVRVQGTRGLSVPTEDADLLNPPALAGALCRAIVMCKAGPSLPAGLWVPSPGGFLPAGKRESNASPAEGNMSTALSTLST